jgi:hypothetical protein
MLTTTATVTDFVARACKAGTAACRHVGGLPLHQAARHWQDSTLGQAAFLTACLALLVIVATSETARDAAKRVLGR